MYNATLIYRPYQFTHKITNTKYTHYFGIVILVNQISCSVLYNNHKIDLKIIGYRICVPAVLLEMHVVRFSSVMFCLRNSSKVRHYYKS